MTNQQLIMEHLEAIGSNFEYNGHNLCTFQEWKRQGLIVKKGQTALFKIALWTCKIEDEKDDNGKVIMENGKPKKKKNFYKKTSALFSVHQIETVEAKSKRKKAQVKKAS